MTEVRDPQIAQDLWDNLVDLYEPGLLTAIQNAIVGRLPKIGLNYVASVLRAPSRNTESTVCSSAGRFPSRKLTRSIGFESATVEYPTILTKERDPRCIALLDQAQPLNVRARSNNRWVGYAHRPDFLCVEDERVVLIECKSLDGIAAKNARNPGFFEFQGGRWTCPTAAEEARKFGFDYEVWTDLDFSDIELRNGKIVDAYLCGATSKYDRQVEIVCAYMDHSEARSVEKLLEDLGSEVTVDGVYAAIARNAIAFNLQSSPLTALSACELFRDESTMRAFEHSRAKPLLEQRQIDTGSVQIREGSQVMWNAVRWRCMSIVDNKITLAPDADVQPIPLGAYQPMPISTFLLMVRSGEMTVVDAAGRDKISDRVASMLQAATKAHLEEANRRYALIVQYLAPGAPNCDDRSLRRYLRSYRLALHELGNGYVGLLPNWADCGNRSNRIAEPVMACVTQFINRKYLTSDRPSILSVYRAIVGDLQQRGYVPPSYNWFCRLIKAMPAYEVALARKGRKGAYVYEPRVECVDRKTTPVAERAFELVHIDHTLIDLVVRTEDDPTRLWLTVMICAATRRVLAFALSFEAPSYRHVMLVMRECVRRYGRLPEAIMVDGGKEFRSTWFESICALFHVIVRRRPKSKARFGAQVERLFGTANTRLFHTLVANTQNTRNVRQLTPEIDPYRRAIWTVSDLKAAIERFFFEDYDQQVHISLLVSPRQAFTTSQTLHGCSPHRLIAFDETFLILSSGTTDKGTATVQPDGVKIQYLYYNHPSLRARLGQKLPVRYDPFNLANAWAQVDGAWVKLTSRFASTLMNHSEHDVTAVTAAWRMRRSAVEQQALTEPHLIRMLQDLETQEQWLALLQQGTAERALRQENSSTTTDGASEPNAVCDEVACDPPPPKLQRLKFDAQLLNVEVL